MRQYDILTRYSPNRLHLNVLGMHINCAQSSLFFDTKKGDAQRTAPLKSRDT